MANSLQVQTSVTTTVDGFSPLSGRSFVSANLTSSNVIAASTAVTSSVWTALDLGALTDVRNIWLWNDNSTFTASVVQVATGSGGGNTLAVLQPGDGMIIPWSGSFTSLYAKVITAAPAKDGVVQYIASQS